MARTDKDKNTNGFGCKYGNSCTKFNPHNIEDAGRLRRLMMKVSDIEFFSWSLIPELFKLFKQEHTKVLTVDSYEKLNNEWKKHFKEYIIVRVSCNTGNLYKKGYDYFNALNNQTSITNYDKVIGNDSTFFYNYNESEDFIEEKNTVKSYMSKMYSEELKNSDNSVASVSNRDQLIEGNGAGSTLSAKYIVVRAKTTYTPSSFVFDATQFNQVAIKIKDGQITTSCSKGATNITGTEPKANTSDLMNIIFSEKCKCGKYHMNTAAYTVWKSAVDRYYKSGSYIYFNGDRSAESNNQKHYLARNTNGDKLNGSLTGNNSGSGGSSNNSGDGTSTDTGTSGGSTGTSGGAGATMTAPDYGDPGLFGGSDDGSTKDLAIYIRGNAQKAEGTANNSNPVQDGTNAEKASNNDQMIDYIYNGTSATTNDATGVTTNTTKKTDKKDSSSDKNKDSNSSGGESGTTEPPAPSVEGTKTTTKAEVEEAAKKSGDDVYGKDMSSLPEIKFVPGVQDGPKSHKTSIFGLPLLYNPLCDPNGRIFGETTMMDLPLIYIQPGRGKINNNLDDKDLADELKEAYKEDGNYAIKSLDKMEDLRALSFEEAFTEYIEYFQNVCSVVYGNMGLGVFKWAEQTNSNAGFLNFSNNGDTQTNIWTNKSLIFFADTATSISDSFSNEYSDAPIISSANNFGVMVRNFKMMTVKDAANMTFQDMSNSWQGASDSGGNKNVFTNFLNDIMAKMGTLWNGSQILFPQVWNDSRHDRSYNLSFKFFSPYGNKEMIFQKVYMPLLALMTMALPRMDSISGYAQPFYVRVNAPGLSTN